MLLPSVGESINETSVDLLDTNNSFHKFHCVL